MCITRFKKKEYQTYIQELGQWLIHEVNVYW
jgi:hypothetical protein